MAQFRIDSAALDGIGDTYATLAASVGDVETKNKICAAGAAVLIEKLREFLAKKTHGTGKLAKSLTAKVSHGIAIVGPSGKHHGKYTSTKGTHRAKTGHAKPRKSSHHGMTNGTSSMDVGYYLEYGTPRTNAIHWMEHTLESSSEEVLAAMAAAWDEHLKSLNL